MAVLQYEADRTLALVDEPRECIFCHRMRSCFVNRDGRTRCFACDQEYVAQGLANVHASAKRTMES
jgi:hypothetical protein